jgi:hypothetical protein
MGNRRDRSLEMDLENMELSPELMAKVKACRSPEEFFALAQEEGRELSDEELEGIAGGWKHPCPKACESGDVRDDIDESGVSAAFMTGEIRGDGLD